MRARLIRTDEGEKQILCSDGTIAAANKNSLNAILTDFRTIDRIKGRQGYWNAEYPEMSGYPGATLAYVTDDYQLVIRSFQPFQPLMEIDVEPSNLISAADYAAMHGRSVEQVKVLCRNGRIPGASKLGRDWIIPADAPYPADGRSMRKK